MHVSLKRLVKGSPPGKFLVWIGRKLKPRLELAVWFVKGRPVPPPRIVKEIVVQSYGRRYKLDTLIETGTFLGDMVEACKRHFARIYSVELDVMLASKATDRFAGLGQVSIFEGDSKEVLPEILAGLNEPALFWLDAHYSGGITAMGECWSPVMEELEAILRHPVAGHVVLVDDARGFAGPEAQPRMEDLRNLVVAHKPDWRFRIRDDIIRLHAE